MTSLYPPLWLGFIDDFHLPARDPRRRGRYRAEKNLPANRRSFSAAGARADFQHNILFIQRIRRQARQYLEALFHLGNLHPGCTESPPAPSHACRHRRHSTIPCFQPAAIKLTVAAEQGPASRRGPGEFAVTLLILVSVRRGQLFTPCSVFPDFPAWRQAWALVCIILILEGGFPPS